MERQGSKSRSSMGKGGASQGFSGCILQGTSKPEGQEASEKNLHLQVDQGVSGRTRGPRAVLCNGAGAGSVMRCRLLCKRARALGGAVVQGQCVVLSAP